MKTMTAIHLMFVSAGTLWWALLPCSVSAFQLTSPCHRQSSNFVLQTLLSRGPCYSDVSGRNRHHLAALGNTDDGDESSSIGDLNSEDDDDDDDDDETPVAETQELRSFLTQRCIQSFMYLLASTRDLHTVSWLDKVVQPITINNYWKDDDDYKPGAEDSFLASDKGLGSKLLNYHGISAMNETMYPEWDTFFTHLLEQPDTVLLIKIPDSVGHRANSEFDIDVEPARLCARILSVREQLAREMAGDLKAIADMGQLIFNSYWDNAKKRKYKKQTSYKSGKASLSGDTDTKDEHDKDSKPFAFDRPSTFYINFDPTDDDAFAPSPLRKGNFDVLYNLITQAAVIQLLQSEDGVVVSEEDLLQNKASQIFLERFYKERLLSHFVGSQWYGKGDDFIEELMLGSPILMAREDHEGGGHDSEDDTGDDDDDEKRSDESKASSKPPLEIEPMRIAEQILQRRDKLALEWMEIMQNVPVDHTEIRRLQLDRLTGVVTKEPETIVFEDEFQ